MPNNRDASASFPDLNISLNNEESASRIVDLVQIITFHTYLILGLGKFVRFSQKTPFSRLRH